MQRMLIAVGLLATLVVPGAGASPVAQAAPDVATDSSHEGHGGVHEAGGTSPEDWTADQREFADDLIARTETALVRFRDPAVLRSLGFTWVFTGEPSGYVHWINLSWFDDDHVLDPNFPESLVYRDTPDGLVLEAAMYSLSFGDDLTTIPEDIAWLPRWHIHSTPVCFDERGGPTGVSDEGRCPLGDEPIVLPPMVHVWTVDTPCGRFAGVDDRGLLTCDLDPVIEA